MDFCEICDNKLYIIEEEGNIYLICYKCGKKKKNTKRVLFRKTYKTNTINMKTVNNNFFGKDNTLPRTNLKKCPNLECPTKKKTITNEAVFFPDQLTYELNYVCTRCFSTWKTS